jgi:hypothetical protein
MLATKFVALAALPQGTPEDYLLWRRPIPQFLAAFIKNLSLFRRVNFIW